MLFFIQDTDESDSDSAESGETEATTVPPATVEPTVDPNINNGRGDNMGYPSDYKKTIIYVDANDIEKIPSPYKYYGPDKTEDVNIISKKTALEDVREANDAEKHLKVHKVNKTSYLLMTSWILRHLLVMNRFLLPDYGNESCQQQHI